MELILEELTRDNYHCAALIQRDDVSESFVDVPSTVMKATEYGVQHHCKGHAFLAKYGQDYVGIILLGEALRWETDPPEMQERPFYRLMGFVIDKRFRGKGLGKRVMDETIDRVYSDFGYRPIALGCHKDNEKAANFYKKNGFVETKYFEGNDVYYLRY